MPVTPTYPGVYIEEVPSGVRTITGVATSITAFLGRALRGPVNDPVRIQSFADYERKFGGLWLDSTMSYAVQHYFLNGGTDAIIVRLVASNATAATVAVDSLNLVAANEGDWSNYLQATVDHDTKDPTDTNLFNLTIKEYATTSPSSTDTPVASEQFRNVSVSASSPRYVESVLENLSEFARISGAVPGTRPAATNNMFTGGGDGDPLTFTEYEGSEADRTGIYALEGADLFNIMCIPPFSRSADVANSTWTAALAYCQDRRAMLIVDPPSPDTWDDPEAVTDGTTGVDSLGLRDPNATLYYPWVLMADPLQENRLTKFAPCGVVAGLFARTDTQRGVWKAPAGQDATMLGVRALAYKMTDGQNGQLNPLGVNCLRTFPVIGNVVWGARTLDGADVLASEWKYVPVRRLALFIEESLYRGTQWVVFEPNDEPLWAQIRLNVGAFMHNLFRQGAFQGSSPKEAYFVKCDSETTTQNDIDRGIVNILVGFAPLKPAEFVIIKISQIAGEVQA